jgi:hypothetical protein
MLEMSQLAFFERQLEQVDTLVGNGDYEFRGYVFSDIQETLSFSVEWMKDQGWGEDKRVRDVLEEEGLSISALRAGKIDEGVLEEGLALAEQYMERGDALFADSESSWESDLELRLYGGGPGLGMACARAKKEGRKMFGCNTGPAPQVDCAAAGKAEKAGTIVGGVCGGAAVLCAVGAIPTAGAACAGLAVCGGVGGALAAGGAAAGAAGGC